MFHRYSGFISSTVVHFLLIAALGFIVYSNTFNSSFHFNDNRLIVKNPFINDIVYFTGSSMVHLKAESGKLSEDVRQYFRTRTVGFLGVTYFNTGHLDEAIREY